MPIRGSRPYLIRRHRRRVTVIAWTILLIVALVAIGLFVAVRNNDRFCKLIAGENCPATPTTPMRGNP